MTFEQWWAAFDDTTGDTYDIVRKCWDAAKAIERERCARVCERTHEELDAEFSPEGCTDSASVAADRIRSGE